MLRECHKVTVLVTDYILKIISFLLLIRAPSSEFVSSSIPSWQILTVHAQPFRGARDLAFCLKVPLDSLLVWASSKGSGETARMRRLAWTFAVRIGDKYQIRLTRSISWLQQYFLSFPSYSFIHQYYEVCIGLGMIFLIFLIMNKIIKFSILNGILCLFLPNVQVTLLIYAIFVKMFLLWCYRVWLLNQFVDEMFVLFISLTFERLKSW